MIKAMRIDVPNGLRATAARAGWSGLDQVLSSGINFAVTIVAARQSDAAAFGAFSLAMIVYTLLIGCLRAFIAQPAIITVRGEATILREKSRSMFGMALVAGISSSFACGATALAVSQPTARIFILLGLALPLLVLQDMGRSVLYGLQQPRAAALNDGAWVAITLVALAVAMALGVDDVNSVFVCWAIGGSLTGLLVLKQVHRLPNLRLSGEWTSHRKLRFSLLTSHLMTVAPSYVLFLVAPAIIGLAGLGLLRAAYLPFSVYGLIMQSASLILLPVLAALEGRAAWRVVTRVSMILTLGAVAWWMVVSGTPSDVGRALLGDAWSTSPGLRTAFGIALTCQAAATASLISLSVINPSRLVRLRVVTGLGSVTAGVALGAAWGPLGIAVAIAGADALAAVVAIDATRRRLRNAT
jgi:O-antigen/teichoic acid export membrane protein